MKGGWQTIMMENGIGDKKVVERNTSMSDVSLIIAATRHGGDVIRPVGSGLGMQVFDDIGNKFYFD